MQDRFTGQSPYDRIGRERDEDLVALCWTCHDGVTDRTMELQRLAKAGRISRSEATPQVAATSFWRVFLRGMGFTFKDEK